MKAHVIPSLMGKVMQNENGSCALGNYYDVEVNVVLKDGAVCPSNPFQHGAELVLDFMGCKEDYVSLQADGGHDHNCESPRNIASLLMMIIKLNL